MEQILAIINEMSPYLLLGFLLAGLMHAFVPGRLYSRYLSAPSWRSVVNAALLGIPLPLCSCGVIPTAMSLRREGASKGATTSFLVATPQTGVDSIVATWSLMGLPFAIVRPIAALCTALFSGVMVNLFDKDAENPTAAVEADEIHTDEHHHHAHEGRAHGDCCCGEGDSCCGDGDCGCDATKAEHAATFGGRIVEALRYAFVDMMGDIGKWLVIGLVVAGLITVFVPTSFFSVFAGNSLLSMLLVLCLAVPMYLCATGSIPIAVALMLKGLTPGAGLVMLMAGPASNVASILVIRKVLGPRTQMIYLASIILGAVAFGLAIDHLLPTEWFISSLVHEDACCVEHTSWFSWMCTAILGVLLFNALVVKPHLHHGHRHAHADGECGCCCGEHDGCASASAEGASASGDGASASGDGASASADGVPASADGVSVVARVETLLVVNGMNCSHCCAAVERALQKVEGVKSVAVDLQTKEARVVGSADGEALRAAVESVGFDVERIERL